MILRPATRLRPVHLRTRLALATILASGLLLGFPSQPSAHEIPPTVTVIAFVKPEGHFLHVVMRVPLEAMRDIDFPTRDLGYLDIVQSQPLLSRAAATWLSDYIALYEGDSALNAVRVARTRIALPTDRSFTSYETAIASFGAPPLAENVDLPWRQAMLDVELEYPIRSEQSRFAIHPALAHLGLKTSTVLRFLPAGGSERAYRYVGDPGLVMLDPRWYQAAFQFVRLGFEHILGGLDHLLFVLCLVIPIRRLRPLIGIVTSFTVAHSITLVASAAGLAPDALWFPALIEVLVALSIVWMAVENIAGARTDRRWMIAFGFGLVHGFAFSFALRETMQFAGSHLAISLLSFNVGVELGQLFVLSLAIPALAMIFRYVVAERMGTIILSALVAHTAWHWMLDRGSALTAYQFVWPSFDRSLLASAMRGAIVLIIAAGALWMLKMVGDRLARPTSRQQLGAE